MAPAPRSGGRARPGRHGLIALTTGGTPERFSPEGVYGPIDGLLYPHRRTILEYLGLQIAPTFVAYATPRVSAAGLLVRDEAHRNDVLPTLAALLSLVLTPVFGATLHCANAVELGDRRLRRVAWMWLALALAFTASGLYLVSLKAAGLNAAVKLIRE